MELGVLLYFMVLKSSTWLLHAINVKSICRQSTYPNHSCFTLYICNSRARDFNSHLFFKIWKNTSGHVCSTEASNDGTSDNETNRLVVQVVKWGLLWNKKYHERRKPKPQARMFRSSKIFPFLHLSNRFVDLFDRKHMAAKWVNENIVKIVNR